jgi:hypothetical protein
MAVLVAVGEPSALAGPLVWGQASFSGGPIIGTKFGGAWPEQQAQPVALALSEIRPVSDAGFDSGDGFVR